MRRSAGRRQHARASRRRRRRALLPACVAIALLVATRPPVARALTLAPMTLEQLTGNAALVVRARCLDRSVERHADGRIDSIARFEVVARAKGEAPDVLAVRQLGGRSGDSELVVPGAPLSEPGDDVVLFLEPRDDGTHGVVGLAIGYLPVVVLPGTGAAVRTSRTLGGVFADGGLHSVDELLARVREITSGATPR